MAIRTKGTELYFVFQDTSGYHMVKLGCPKGISGLGGSKPQIDETCLDSEEMEFGPGMGNPGAITVDLDFDTSKISHKDLIAMDEDDTVTTWVVCLSDGTAAPTVDVGSGNITCPSTRTYISFQGYIADLPLDFKVNANVASAASIQRSGAKTWHYKA